VIHKTAIIDKEAKISENVQIGPYCTIGPKVKIGSNSKLHSHVNIVGNTSIGDNNEIFPFSSIGTPPQDLKYKGEENSIIIGNNNKFREYVNINPGTEQGGTITKIGNNNLFMVYCHVAHDCNIKDNVVLANNVQVGGHVLIQNNAIVGGSCAIHQFSRIGQSAMIGGMTGVLSDVIPFGLSLGNRNNLVGLNLIGLRRAGISNEDIKIMQSSYEIIFKTSNFRINIENLDQKQKDNKYVKSIIKFINSDKKRPISLPENLK
jgi:acyl-[acyl-carrier-protein]--UDP-N-acetylglucosamine O-acyltransferase